MFPCPVGAVTSVSQGCLSYWHPSLGMAEPCFPRQVSLCLTMLLGARLNIPAPFLARELACCPCVSGRRCPGIAPRRWSSPGHPAQPGLPTLVLCCHGPSDWNRGTQLPFSLSAFPPQVPASSCPAPLELRISGPGSLTCGTTPSSLTCRRGQKMGSRYPELPGTWGRKPVVPGDMLMQQSNGAGRGEALGFWAQVASLSVPALPCGCSGT